MTRRGVLEQARASFAERFWGDARAKFETADATKSLDLDDLEKLALASYLTGHDAESTRAWTRAHHEAIRHGDPRRAARNAFLAGSGAKVLATDWSPKMIDHFDARVSTEGLDAEGRVMDCHALDLPDDSFDVTGSLFGVMLVPDQAQALREMVRVTKPGGRVLVIAYGDPADFEAMHVFISAVQAVVPDFAGPPEDEPPLEFQLADPHVLRQRLLDSGLREITVDTSNDERIAVRTGQQLWDWTMGGNPLPGMLVADLTDHQRMDIIMVLDGMVRERSGANSEAVLTAPLNIGVGTK